jgi:hypothetical protein
MPKDVRHVRGRQASKELFLFQLDERESQLTGGLVSFCGNNHKFKYNPNLKKESP